MNPSVRPGKACEPCEARVRRRNVRRASTLGEDLRQWRAPTPF